MIERIESWLGANRQRLLTSGRKHAWRLDMEKTLALVGKLSWTETGDGEKGEIAADPSAWGDVVLSRSDAPSSYHLSVVVDDALQAVTHVVRGLDLFHATSVHRLLQALLDLPAPIRSTAGTERPSRRLARLRAHER